MKPTQCSKFVDEFIAKSGRDTATNPDLYRLDLMQAWTCGYCAGIEKGFLIGTGEPQPDAALTEVQPCH